MISYVVTKQHEKKDLYDLLESVYPNFSLKDQDKALKYGDIDFNGKPADGTEHLKQGDKIDIFLPADIVGIDLTPQIVYQDENFVIVDKPAGLLSASDYDEPNAVSLVEDCMKTLGEYNLNALMVPYLVYDLEKDVSGLLILSKHEAGYLFVIEALNQRRISKHFLCPIVGITEDEDELLAYYAKDKALTNAKILDKFQKGAKPIVTRYTTLARSETMSLVSARPVTNGLHQVRAHMAYYDLPVLGDDQYGNRRFNRKHGAVGLALCLKSLEFQTGTNHEYQYMNGKRFESQQISFPKCVYDEGLMDSLSF
jgi:23S rRNA-/tRNA-specific pseudouridylate synthase